MQYMIMLSAAGLDGMIYKDLRLVLLFLGLPIIIPIAKWVFAASMESVGNPFSTTSTAAAQAPTETTSVVFDPASLPPGAIAVGCRADLVPQDPWNVADMIAHGCRFEIPQAVATTTTTTPTPSPAASDDGIGWTIPTVALGLVAAVVVGVVIAVIHGTRRETGGGIPNPKGRAAFRPTSRDH